MRHSSAIGVLSVCCSCRSVARASQNSAAAQRDCVRPHATRCSMHSSSGSSQQGASGGRQQLPLWQPACSRARSAARAAAKCRDSCGHYGPAGRVWPAGSSCVRAHSRHGSAPAASHAPANASHAHRPAESRSAAEALHACARACVRGVHHTHCACTHVRVVGEQAPASLLTLLLPSRPRGHHRRGRCARRPPQQRPRTSRQLLPPLRCQRCSRRTMCQQRQRAAAWSCGPARTGAWQQHRTRCARLRVCVCVCVCVCGRAARCVRAAHRCSLVRSLVLHASLGACACARMHGSTQQRPHATACPAATIYSLRSTWLRVSYTRTHGCPCVAPPEHAFAPCFPHLQMRLPPVSTTCRRGCPLFLTTRAHTHTHTGGGRMEPGWPQPQRVGHVRTHARQHPAQPQRCGSV
jgi:hypothetical protein